MKPDQAQFPLRISIPMRDRIRRSAEANRRSMNSQIEHYLDLALAGEEKGAAEGATSPRHVHATPAKGKGDEYAQ